MLFKSLRERVLVFFSLLILLVHALSFVIVDQAGKSISKAQAAHDIESGQVLFKALLSAEYQKIDGLLNHLVVNELSIGAAAVQFFEEAYFSSLVSHDTSILLARHDDYRKLPAVNGNLEVSDTAQNTFGRFLSSHRPAMSGHSPYHSGLLIDGELYLVSSLPMPGGKESRLSVAVPVRDIFEPLVERALGAELIVGEKLPHGQAVNFPNTEQRIDMAFVSQDAVSNTHFDRQKIFLMLLLAASLMLTLLGGYALAHELTRPLKALTKAARRIKSGNYEEKVEIYQRDEIGQLAATINHMQARIAHREENIMKLAYADPLTGLPNRALFDDRLSRAVITGRRTDEPFSVVIMDLDRFKYINDVLGHESGDFVLQQIALRLQNVLRESDTIARLGGDEFALLMYGERERHITALYKIINVFEMPVILNNQPLDIACSMGIACFPEHGDESSLLMRRADVAMYSAKRLNSTYAFYDPECEQHQQEHLSLLGEIKGAVENNEFQLYFQPKVSFDNEDCLSVETLLRWQHPRRGLIPPEEFIPFAEQTGVIKLITGWVIHHAIKQCGEWLLAGLEIKVSLNISARDLLDPDFPEIVWRELTQNNVPASQICMEITESVLMEDPARARRTIETLNSMGIEMSIDDYGTGYSSLAYVKNLPVSELKIDREFVKNMIDNEEDIAIVRSTIELGHNLGLKVVAEGIEKREELDMLKSFGCDQGQGFLISHALTAADLEQWIVNHEYPSAAEFKADREA